MLHFIDTPLLFAQNLDVWQEVLPHVHIKKANKDDVVLHHGDSAGYLWMVLSGWVKLTRQTPDGKETIIGLCTDGDVFGEAALFLRASYPYHAEVITPTAELVLIPAEIMRSVIKKDTEFSGCIMSLLNERVAQTQLKLEHMSTMSAAQRLGCFLLRLCNKNASDKQILQIPIEKRLLATYLGMKPETLSRSQQQLKIQDVSVSGFQVDVGSVAELRNFVCDSCSGSGNCEEDLQV